MVLPQNTAHAFIQLHGELMLFAGQEIGDLPAKMTVVELLRQGAEGFVKYRELIYQDLTIIDRYIASLKGEVTDQLLEDVDGFRHYIRGDFYIMKHYRKYTVLMGNDRLYGILGLSQSIEEIVPKWALPAMVETVILPFRGYYIYDGLMMGSHISFGRNMKASMNDQFKKLKAVHGIIDKPGQSVKIGQPGAGPEKEAERELRYIMNSMKRWEEEVYRLDELRDQFPQLENVFLACASKLYAKRRKKELKSLGVSGRYFAVYFNATLASAATRKELLKELAGVSFSGRVEDCAIFKV